jgi:hypothetical protein
LQAYKALFQQSLRALTVPFLAPVAELYPGIADTYYATIKQPMDLRTIGLKLDRGTYKSYGEFVGDVRRTFENGMQYNRDKLADAGSAKVYHSAQRLLAEFGVVWADTALSIAEQLRRLQIEQQTAESRQEIQRKFAAQARK